MYICICIYIYTIYTTGDGGLFPGSEQFPGEGKSNPFQCSCLENLPWTEETGGL